MSPLAFLALLIAVTLGARLADWTLRRRRARSLRRLAIQRGMNYTPADSLEVTSEIARRFPIPGAANLRIRDLIYGVEGDRHLYVFTAEYTSGVVRTKRRVLRVGTFSEPRNRTRRHSSEPEMVVLAADSEQGLEAQYCSLLPAARR